MYEDLNIIELKVRLRLIVSIFIIDIIRFIFVRYIFFLGDDCLDYIFLL